MQIPERPKNDYHSICEYLCGIANQLPVDEIKHQQPQFCERQVYNGW